MEWEEKIEVSKLKQLCLWGNLRRAFADDAALFGDLSEVNLIAVSITEASEE